VRSLPTFRDAFRRRRCIVPVDGFFGWKAIKGQKAKQPYCHRHEGWQPVRSRRPMGELERPDSDEWVRTFAIITTAANELVAEIHDQMPLILAPNDCLRWLSEEPDPSDLLRPFPAEPMRIRPISTACQQPENDPSILEPIELAAA
jgi:putative SOS response-associated peptidase YedK